MESYSESNERLEHRRRLVERVKSLGLKEDEYIVISSAAMELLGCNRTSVDIDILVSEEVYNEMVQNATERNLEEVVDNNLKMLSGNGFNIFFDLVLGVGDNREIRYLRDYEVVESKEGISCMSLADIKEYKEKRNKLKDLKDIVLIAQKLNES